MSHQINHTPFGRFNRWACAIAMAVVVIGMAPVRTGAHEPANDASNATAQAPMDHSKMAGMSMTGDVDYDFAANMRTHHQKAVDMSEAELKSGKNPQMLQMAKDIIAAQKKEIAVFDQWLEAHKKATTEAMPKSKS